MPRLRNEVFRLGKRLAGSRLRQPRRAGVSSTRTPPVLADLQRFRPEGFVDYLYHRYANPSFVTSVPMMGLLEQVAAGGDRSRPAVLDLGCGTGHSTAMMGVLFPANAYVAADPDFVNLLLLRRHFAPDATCICLDAELPLPFTDSQFDAVFCLDAFHYIRSKWALVHELDRVVTDHGVWIFPHLHNAERCNPSPGLPLSAGGYLRIFDFLDAVLLDETTVLRDFVDERVLDVTTAPPLDDVTSAAAFSMFGSRRRGSGRRRFEIGQRLIEVDRAALGLNPIYEVTPSATTVELRMSWPDRGLEAECSMIRSIAPERLELDRDAWERINATTTDPRDEALIASLIETFVLVHLPPGYTHLVDAV